MRSILRLFKALSIKDSTKKKANKVLLEKTIQKGFVFAPEVIGNYSEKELFQLTDTIEKETGLTPEQMNNSFHKSWKKVKEANIEQLVLEQITHYFTTYGFELFGIYSSDSVYIPSEKLEIPDIDDKINLVVIKGYTKDEIKEKLMNLLVSGIALKKDTINDVVDVALWLEIGNKEIENIKNKEVRNILYNYLNIIPENPVEFLRYLIYESTEKTLLIKNPSVIEEIKSQKNIKIIKLFMKYDQTNGLEKLAEIFYRFKPLFLAFKTNPQLSRYINKLRKLAVKYHKPMKPDYLNGVTSMLKKRGVLSFSTLKNELDKVSIFRQIRLAYALKFRTKEHESILYRVRNGKGYATDFSFFEQEKAEIALDIVTQHIIGDINKKIEGKKIYIPDYIKYTLPATEKMFTGNFPSGSHVIIPNNMVFGIHWNNVKHNRIDLDLSTINAYTKFGWDSNYRNEDRTILFSGDMTDAQGEGASELFYVKKQENTALIMFVNYYNFDADIEIPFKILAAKENAKNFEKNYTVNPNNVMAIANSTINQKQKILGLVVITENESKFYFTETYLGKSITSSKSEFVAHSRRYLFDFYSNTISLNDILERSGAVMVLNNTECDTDLSPEKLERDSIIKLLV